MATPERPRLPTWVVVGLVIGGVLVAVWLVGAIFSTISFLLKLVLSLAVVFGIAWLASAVVQRLR